VQQTDIGAFVGMPYNSIPVQDFVTSLLGAPVVSIEPLDPSDIHYVFENHGVEMIVDAKTSRIDTIFLEMGFHGTLPKGLDFSMNRKSVLSMLGEPDATGESPPYDAWEEGDYKIRVEYKNDASMKFIVLMGM
jgi:hypothetical protein